MAAEAKGLASVLLAEDDANVEVISFDCADAVPGLSVASVRRFGT